MMVLASFTKKHYTHHINTIVHVYISTVYSTGACMRKGVN